MRAGRGSGLHHKRLCPPCTRSKRREVSTKDWQVLRRYQQLDAPRDSWLAANESAALQGQHHLMDRRWAHREKPLHVALRRRTTIEPYIRVDECKVLPLRRGEVARSAGSQGYCPV